MKSRLFFRSFCVKADLQQVLAFHRDPSSLEALTPSLIPLRISAAASRIEEGTEVRLRIWLGPIPVDWVSKIEEFGHRGFRDRQISGPFRKWVHHHRFVPLEDGGCRVEDEIEAEFGDGLRNWILCAQFWSGLSALFAYRRVRTQRLLQNRSG